MGKIKTKTDIQLMIKTDNIKISNQMLTIISEIDEFKITWKLLGKMAPERLKSLKKVATIESVGSSNRIEGNKLSDIEKHNVKLILEEEKSR